MVRWFGKIIRRLFTSKPEEVVTTEDLKRDVEKLLNEDKEILELVKLLLHQEEMLASLTPKQLEEMRNTQMQGYHDSIKRVIAETETKIAKLFAIKSRHEEEFRELLQHLKEVERIKSIGKNLDVAA